MNDQPIEIYQVSREAQGVTVKRTPKWGGLGERVLKLQDGESIVLESEGDLTEETD